MNDDGTLPPPSDAPSSSAPLSDAPFAAAPSVRPPEVREVMPSNLPPAISLRPPPAEAAPGPMIAVVALIEQNEWSKVCAQLEPMRDALPATSPSLGLLYAVAKHEDALSRSGSRDVRDPETERLARESLALLLDIGLDSAAARLLSLRLLRRPWSSAPAPSARTSALIVFVAVAIGALVGWLLDEGFDRFFHR